MTHRREDLDDDTDESPQPPTKEGDGVASMVKTALLSIFIAAVPGTFLWVINLEYRVRFLEYESERHQEDARARTQADAARAAADQQIRRDLDVLKTQMDNVQKTLDRRDRREE